MRIRGRSYGIIPESNQAGGVSGMNYQNEIRNNNYRIFVLCLLALVALAFWVPSADAYPDYTGCGACHGDFRASNYVSLMDGQSWGNLHDLHRTTMLGGDCNVCHSGASRKPVYIASSAGGTGLQAISCMGCHGRSQDAGHDDTSGGLGAGLRQHHTRAGQTDCQGCHSDATPANYTPVGENVKPPYYATPGTGHPNMPTDPCNANPTATGKETFAGSLLGLDTDGNDLYDGADPACAAAPPKKMSRIDFDNDVKTDITVWRPSTGQWWLLRSSNATSVNPQWGTSGDVLVPGDYDGDGMTDYAVWRPSTGFWWIKNSATGSETGGRKWGDSGDVLVPGDYDGDGKTDFAIWRPSTGFWWIINSSNGAVTSRQWGTSGDVLVPGDYDGDGKTDYAVWRPSTGFWWIINSSNGAVTSKQWGASGDNTAPGDYDGDGKTDFAVWRPSTGFWWIINSSNGTVTSRQWGTSGDMPVKIGY